MKTVSIEGKSVKPIKEMHSRYGSVNVNKGSLIKRVLPQSMHSIVDKQTKELDSAIDRALFEYVEKEVTLEEAAKIDSRITSLIHQGDGKTNVLANGVDRNIFSEGNVLAEKILKDNVVDFHDQRITVSQQKISNWKSHIDSDIVQIDLGRVRSLDKSEILNENVDFNNLPQDSHVIDEYTNQNTEFDLVLVGRKLTKEEQSQHGMDLEEHANEDQNKIKHFINKEIFHEADLSNVTKGARKGEGAFMYFTRNYMKIFILIVLSLLTQSAYTLLLYSSIYINKFAILL